MKITKNYKVETIFVIDKYMNINTLSNELQILQIYHYTAVRNTRTHMRIYIMFVIFVIYVLNYLLSALYKLQTLQNDLFYCLTVSNFVTY